jgi:hypothetical protein
VERDPDQSLPASADAIKNEALFTCANNIPWPGVLGPQLQDVPCSAIHNDRYYSSRDFMITVPACV